MNPSDLYQHLCESGAQPADPGLAADLALLEERAQALGIPLQQSLPIADPRLLVDAVIALAQEFQHRQAGADLVLARQTIVDVERPHQESDPLEFANALGVLATILADQDRWEEALARALECAAFLAPRATGTDDAAALHARALKDAGTYHARLGQRQESIAAKRQALAVFERCAAVRPDFRTNIAVVCNELAPLLLQEPQDVEEALQVSERSVELLSGLLDDPGYGAQAEPDLAYALWQRTVALALLQQPEQALDSALQAVPMLRTAAGSMPVYADLLARALDLASDLLSAADRDAEAHALAAEAAELAETLRHPPTRLLARWAYARRLLEADRIDDAMHAYLRLIPDARDTGQLEDLAPQLVDVAHRLADHTRFLDAAEVTAEALELYEVLSAQDEDWIPAHAHTLGWLAEVQSLCGRPRQALAAARAYAALAAEALPGTAVHARALNVLGTCLSATARLQESAQAATAVLEEAEQAGRAAVELWTALADPQDPQDQAGLAAAWTNLSNRLIDLGRMEEAAAAAQRSVAVHPAGSPDRANALNSLAITLWQLGRHEQARDTETEAIRLFDAIDTGTGLTPQQRTHLASTLCNRADSHSMLGDDVQAAADADRAVQIFYEQWSAEPAPHEGYLLRALHKKLEYCAQAQDGQGAVDAATLQVHVLQARPETEDREELAAALIDLGGCLMGLDRYQEAAQAFSSAEDAGQGLPPLQAIAQCRHALCRFHMGRLDEAIRIARQGITLLEAIEADDAAYLLWLGQLCHDLGVYLRADGRMVEALGTTGRAVAIRERLVADEPDLHTGPLAHSLELMADLLTRLGRHEQARNALDRAADLLD